MPGPLYGMKVIDLSRVLAGPYCTMILGDMGAEVIKIESIDTGDETRGWGPPFVEGESAYYLCANRNKQGITLNLKSEQGIEILQKLILDADVVIQNFKPGTLKRLGFGYEEMKNWNKGIILASISGFGSTGPYSHLPGYDYMIQAMSGLMSITGDKDAEPVKVGVAIADVLTGLYTCIGVLGAIHHRNTTEEGQEVDISLFDSQLAAMVNVASNYLCSGQIPEGLGNAHPNIVPYQVFTASDGDFVIAVGNDQQYRKLAVLLEDPSLLSQRYETNAGRLQYKDELVSRIAKKIKTKSRTQWKQLLDVAGIPNGPIHNVKEALESEQAISINMIVDVKHTKIPDLKLVGSPLKFSKTEVNIERHPPLLREHTEEVLIKLGYSISEIHAMKKNKII
ncbi:crotonobetainyl-CoA:carnitine CoA-transferase CaiB-like acyl-CoA transferase [Bacillus niacini]|uniref:Crotonobetainyl-CoA:carnitine CoA-transferase CaiB-like acyl-CoA transferase n=1 Tax=Neobacillus niacini TaxID=86668 RepID=A0A852T7S8_9BACI|nr:CaiB/BaiF CoA-transferase family protein [Neobacillus niacini]NYE03895.1 crotonobetainyl-CoA:carnitine CoA-transferase CaiB-like acyl-CoA transferase [Neobacillus niacini]